MRLVPCKQTNWHLARWETECTVWSIFGVPLAKTHRNSPIWALKMHKTVCWCWRRAQNLTSRRQFCNVSNAVYGRDTYWIKSSFFLIKDKPIFLPFKVWFNTFLKARISMLNKDTHQRYECHLVHNRKFIVTMFYVIFGCVTKFKTSVNWH